MKIHGDASKALAKVSPVLTQLQQMMKADEALMKDLPSFAVKKAKSAVAALTSVDTEARRELSNDKPKNLSFTLEEVSDKTKEASESKTLLTNLLAAIKKHR